MTRCADFGDVQEFVRRVLCDRADLDYGSPFFWNVLKRKGRPCGVEFTLVAPRSVRLSAIWECTSGRVLFYDQNMQRFHVESVVGVNAQHLPDERQAPALTSMWRGR